MMLDALKLWIDQHQKRFARIGVAFSGGRDSTTLLQGLAQLRENHSFQLFAIHVNHGLMPQAPEWQDFCSQVCKNLSIPLEIIHLNLNITPKDSVEDIARKARYAAFADLLLEGDVLCTAHHQNDQAETFLLQLARGAGIKGLSGIAHEKPCGQGMLARPLLKVTQSEIVEYAKTQGLQWVEDGSNQNYAYKRNYVRHELMPKFTPLQPAIGQCIQRSVQHIKDANALLNEYLAADLKLCTTSDNVLNLALLRARSTLQQLQLLRLWFAKAQLRAPSTKKLKEIHHQFFNARMDKNPSLKYEGVEIHRFQDKLYVVSEQGAPLVSQHWDPNKTQRIGLSNGKSLQAKKVRGSGIACHKLQSGLSIQPRKGGETCQLANEPFTRKLKKVLHAACIPHWQRDQLPLLYSGEALVSVPNVLITEGWQARGEEDGWLIEVEYPQ